jgi:hypothetical protein
MLPKHIMKWPSHLKRFFQLAKESAIFLRPELQEFLWIKSGKTERKNSNAISLKLIDTGRKIFIFITCSSDSVGLQNCTEIQGQLLHWSDMEWPSHSVLNWKNISLQNFIHICSYLYNAEGELQSHDLKSLTYLVTMGMTVFWQL